MGTRYGFIYAHPDDETFLSAAVIRELADQGEAPALLLATRGDAGRQGLERAKNRTELARLREEEMKVAAGILGIAHTEYLGWPDGQLATIDFPALVAGVIAFIQKHELAYLFTFSEDGGNGHPDHVTISKATTAAVLSGECPSVRKLYYTASASLIASGHTPSIRVDTERWWTMKAAALRAHATQYIAIEKLFGDLANFPENHRWEAFVLGWQDGVMWPKPKI
ncbi:PIG-L domain-containing protein [Paenibacillus marchantiophytorum]|uniref:PIG-L domain-containing protein n=1 Tax=Paenibacillus marchantiophytorum TaxID=1619310 RepID=A0ABQ1EUY8_9BACL|nr:PIG-L family deacetylase [Paenibacillus marchantiophytorum]GFZ87557.1 PIG-L domain-containing protein [Paenibacillus marchantiophytorum]